jgi:hypothetical protein
VGRPFGTGTGTGTGTAAQGGDGGVGVHGEALCLFRRCTPRRCRSSFSRANENARKLAPIIKAIQAQGITTLNGIAAALNGRRVPTPRGSRQMGGYAGTAAVEAVGGVMAVTAHRCRS